MKYYGYWKRDKNSPPEKVEIKSVVMNDEGKITLYYTNRGPKYIGEIIVEDSVKSKLHKIKKQV